MLDNQTYEILLQALRALFLLAIPVCLAVTLAGTLIGALQSVTSIHDPAIGYGVRLLALVLVLYLMLPSFIQSLIILAELAFR